MLTEETFLKDVKDHKLKILKNDGLYRHIVLSNDDTKRHWFELITWPHHLCINGDMGTYAFSRVEDMFKFFRSADDSLYVNLGYWAEKCTAEDRDGVMRFSEEAFREAVKVNFLDYSGCLSDSERSDVWREIEEQVLYGVSYKEEAYQAISSFKMQNHDHIFDDFYEINCDEYTYQYTWCCYAIAWAIKQYDGYNLDNNQAASDG